MVITFENKEQLRGISSLVNMVAGIYDQSAVSTISNLAGRLSNLYTAMKDAPDSEIKVELSEDPADNHDNDEVLCLYHIVKMANDSGANEVDAACDMCSKLRKHYIKSDVPRFLEMLRDYHVPAEYCVDLFGDWCSGEGLAGMAEKCMDIQAAHNIIMTPVWEWICNNDASPDTDWRTEVNKYKEAINHGC